MRPLSILDIRDTHEIGGPGKTILESYRAIDRDRFRPHLGYFCAPNDRADSPFIAAARDIGMPVHPIPARSAYDVSQVWRLAALVQREGFDIVHPHEVSSDVVTLAMRALCRVSIVSTVHGWIGNTARDRFLNDLDRRVLRRYDLVIAVSARIRQQLLDAGVPNDRIALLHNAIVLENYQRHAQPGDESPEFAGAGPGPVLVSLGRLSPEKGHADLIEALRLVAARGVSVSAVLAGDGPSRAALEAQVAAAGLGGQVSFPGYVSTPARLLRKADLVVLPSHTEGLPNAALEAFAMEVPLLATAVGGTPEVVTNGVTGTLVPPHSPEALAGGILDFVENQAAWRQRAKRARQVVEEQFDFTVRTRKLEQLYLSLAGSASQRGGPSTEVDLQADGGVSNPHRNRLPEPDRRLQGSGNKS